MKILMKEANMDGNVGSHYDHKIQLFFSVTVIVN